MYWMFGFKYWVISMKVPRMIAVSKEGSEGNHKRICSEAKYEVLNWVGILVNLGFCLAIGWKRGILEYDSAFGQPSHELAALVITFYMIVTFLLIVSAVFLSDALRRLKNSFSKDKILVVN
jgi:hypothetical protein